MLNANQLIDSIPDIYRKDLELISREIQNRGKESFLIGGSVRDLILTKIPAEYDLTTSMLPEDVKKTFKRVIETGIKHGTVTVLLADRSYEITTYRKDIDYTDGRRPDRIEFGESLSEDLKRRDFTMNAIALDILNAKIIDEHDGIKDIENKIIRTIGDPLKRFGEDGLRPIRAIRFLSTLDFKIEEKTYEAIFNTRHITEKISRERFHDELNKILCSKNPTIGLKELEKNQIFELFTKAKININQKINLDSIDKLELSPFGLRLAYFLNWLLAEDDAKTQAEQFLQDIRYSRVNQNDCLFYLELFLEKFRIEYMSSIEIRSITAKIVAYSGNRTFNSFFSGLISYLSIYNEKHLIAEFQAKIQVTLHSNCPLVLKDLAVNGNQIIDRFPDTDKRQLGLILKNILRKTIESPDINEPEKIFALIENKQVFS